MGEAARARGGERLQKQKRGVGRCHRLQHFGRCSQGIDAFIRSDSVLGRHEHRLQRLGWHTLRIRSVRKALPHGAQRGGHGAKGLNDGFGHSAALRTSGLRVGIEPAQQTARVSAGHCGGDCGVVTRCGEKAPPLVIGGVQHKRGARDAARGRARLRRVGHRDGLGGHTVKALEPNQLVGPKLGKQLHCHQRRLVKRELERVQKRAGAAGQGILVADGGNAAPRPLLEPHRRLGVANVAGKRQHQRVRLARERVQRKRVQNVELRVHRVHKHQPVGRFPLAIGAHHSQGRRLRRARARLGSVVKRRKFSKRAV